MKLSDIFKNEPGLNGIRKIISQSDVVIEFNKIFPDLEKIAVPIKVDKKVLLLKVENPAWRNELKFKEELIIHKVNKFFKEERIKWVKLTT
ncbi:MAG: DUF721 domain-containing protein [Ignavibacteriaceae bacterium]